MPKRKLFNDIMKMALKSSQAIQRYDSTPRVYGDETLFQAECHTIDMIGSIDNVTVTDIAKATNKSKSAVSQMVVRLIKKGFVTKSRREDNERNVDLALTPKGRKIYEFHKEYDRQSYETILACIQHFTVDELHTYLSIQEVLVNQLTANADNSSNKQ